MFSTLFRIVTLIALIVLPSCYSPLDEPSSFPAEEQLDERSEAEPVAKDFYGNLVSGQIWSTPIGQVGLGGVGREVALGELELNDPTVQQAVLTLGLQNLDPGTQLGTGRIYARIQYGIGSANQTVLIDWAQTQSIALPVGKANVTAIQVDAQGLPALFPGTGTVINPLETIDHRIILTTSLAAGERSSVQAPTLTQTINLAAGVAQQYSVPARGKRVLVGDARGQAASDLLVFLIGSFSTNGFALANAADSAIRTDGVVLPGLTDNIQITSPGGWNGAVICWLLDG